ncbi:MAG: T9SS C-terminal target domain-containing protein [Flavobacteriales bacterium]|nr:T9SS C-terminal target domain-containing protein [Crocinitomicaceae bacterium]NBX80607.1 T9SS C-terminal target domain-containing protein [Flavobacteriales bacterium]NCA20151.1 T9SS C-terminal target domain-containing protein [Crocinitomicaceae bacterium]
MKTALLLLIMAISSVYHSQILEISPAFPTVNNTVTIIYDATQGNGALVGQTQIYAHTGVITSTSTSPTNWLFTKGTWGTADPTVAMTSIGNNKFSITIDIDVFYAFPQSTNVLKLAFVFRNATGSIVGRSADGSDIYYDVYPTNAGLVAQIFHPGNGSVFQLNEQFTISSESNIASTLTLKENGTILNSLTNATVLSYQHTATNQGTNLLELIANDGTNEIIDSIYYTVNPAITVLDPPTGLKNGANYINDSTVILQLYAPEKEFVYVIGDFNNWIPSDDFYMNLSTDSKTWWLELPTLVAGQKYGYQYFIDGSLKLADPMSTLILDPNNDGAINALTYPDRLPYPTGETTGFVTVIQPGAPQYEWQNTNFSAPANKDLVIYELHMRDFIAKHNYQTLIDTLDYLDNLGINAIELMPPGEFENNESWGYNPSFHMALDKYYGTPAKFKELIDSCHARGIAIIVDMVLNHAFGQSPMVNMYWDAANNRTAANSPWFNAVCPHQPYCWGYDFDHTKQATKNYIDQVNRYWIQEYNVDGFRFDYTKGFINNSNGFSQDRINILKRMADSIWTVKSDAYIILEHWCDNSEEKQLAEYGMMLWGNLTSAYADAGMGYVSSSNVSQGIYSARTWTSPHLVTYMESHDEERMMYKNLTFGSATNPNHNTKNSFVALGRMQTAAVIFLTQPGPKMLWQFEELGYDISIDNPCRVCNKPILWNYYNQSRRKQLYDVYAATLKLRNDYETFRSLDFNYMLFGAVKRMKMNHPSMKGVSIANFDINDQSASPAFQHTGYWYEYFTGDSLNVTDVAMTFTMAPGEYRIYTDVRLDKPTITPSTASIEEISKESFDLNVYPNPTSDYLKIDFLNDKSEAFEVLLINENGQVVDSKKGTTKSGENSIEYNTSNLKSGAYHALVKVGKMYSNKAFVVN